jgi:hypothetical protein
MSNEEQNPTTVCEKSKFKNHDMITITEVDENGKKEKMSLLNFGKKKAQAIVKHFEDIKTLAES